MTNLNSSLSEITPIIFDIELTQLGSEVSVDGIESQTERLNFL